VDFSDLGIVSHCCSTAARQGQYPRKIFISPKGNIKMVSNLGDSPAAK
jgi:hypothetical protein